MPPTAIHPVPCDYCRYDLAGIAPNDAASPHIFKCPECGNLTDTCKLPPRPMRWWRVPLALFAGSATTGAAILLVHWVVLRALAGSWFSLMILFFPMLLGGAVSMSIIWHDRIAGLRWQAKSWRLPTRQRYLLFSDFVFFCFINGAIVVAIPYAIKLLS